MYSLEEDVRNVLQEMSRTIDEGEEERRMKYVSSEPNSIIISSEMFYELQESFDISSKEDGFSLFGMKVIINESMPMSEFSVLNDQDLSVHYSNSLLGTIRKDNISNNPHYLKNIRRDKYGKGN